MRCEEFMAGCARILTVIIPLSILDSSPSRRARRRATRCATASTSPGTPSAWAIRRIGSPNTTTCRHRQRRHLGGDRYVAGGTSTIRVGAGGIMLPNHAPLVDRRAVRHAGVALSRPDRPRPRPRAGDRSAGLRALRRDPARADEFPQDVQELQAFLRPSSPARSSGGAGRRAQRSAVDPRLEPLRRAARRAPRPALRVRVAFRARRADGCAGDLPRAVPALRRSSTGPTP